MGMIRKMNRKDTSNSQRMTLVTRRKVIQSAAQERDVWENRRKNEGEEKKERKERTQFAIRSKEQS